MYKDFENRVAIITGAASGLGLAIAKRLSQLKARLVLFDSNEDSLVKIKSEFKNEVKVFIVDVTLKENVKTAIDEVGNHFGRIDILINSAGVGGGDTIAQTSTKDFDRVLKTNLYGTFWCARAAYKQIKRNKSKNKTG